jgi:cytochrome c oxidase subunit 2
MRRILALLIWLSALLTAGFFLSGRWWWPRLVSVHGVAVDRQFTLTLTVIGSAFIVVQLLLGFIVWRSDSARGTVAHGNNRLEIFWTVATALVFITLAVMGQRVWRAYHFAPTPANAFRVGVWGQQFQWNFHYAGADARPGRTNPALISDAGGNPIGLDRANDPAAQDDIVAPTLILPLNRPTELLLHARDVTHSLWLPNMRFKQDAVPGLNVRAYLTATVPGLYDAACAELCGQQHYKMNAKVLVLPEDEFNLLMQLPPDQWPAKRNEFLAKYAPKP